VGINLTQANHVFMMEPLLNPALEEQAVGRVHRMGQTRAVQVVKVGGKGRSVCVCVFGYSLLVE
jgi:SNF2 family DNA or RNA helicase